MCFISFTKIRKKERNERNKIKKKTNEHNRRKNHIPQRTQYNDTQYEHGKFTIEK